MAKVIWPADCGEMPMSRAPSRFTAVARKALPRSVRSKNSQSRTISAMEASAMMMAWPVRFTSPSEMRRSQNDGLR